MISKPLHLPLAAEDWTQPLRWSRLDDACEGVFDCPHTTPQLADEGPFVVRSQDIRGRTFDYRNAGRVSEETYQERIVRAEPRFGDLLYSREGTYFGIAAEVPRDLRICLGQRMVLIRADRKELDHRFLLYWLNSPVMEGHLGGFRDGSVAERLNMATIRALPVPILPLTQQREIAAVLGALDDKIEVNRKTAATLEEMARALYRSWFVDFDPVWAKLEGRPTAHMDAATAALFPDRFNEEGLPEGWDVKPLSKLVSPERGLSYKGGGLCEEADGVPLHNLNSIFEGGGYKPEGIKFYNGAFKKRHEIVPGDLIVANTEQGFDLLLMGHAAIVPHYLGPSGIFSQHIYKVSPKAGSPLSREWLYLMLSVTPKGQEIRSYSNGTTVNMLPIDAFEIPEVCVPSHQIVQAFDTIVKPMFARQEFLVQENQTLANLRDTLLPRLMSGELRVGEARELVEDVA